MDLKKFNPWNWFHKEDRDREKESRQGLEVRKTEHHPALQLYREFDRLFDQLLDGFPMARGSMGAIMRPQVDISESNSEYRLELELPGVELKDVELTVRDGVLVVRGEKSSTNEKSERNTHRVERYYGSFQRVFSLPEDADEENIQATLNNGVLRIEVARKARQELSGVRTITINQS